MKRAEGRRSPEERRPPAFRLGAHLGASACRKGPSCWPLPGCAPLAPGGPSPPPHGSRPKRLPCESQRWSPSASTVRQDPHLLVGPPAGCRLTPCTQASSRAPLLCGRSSAAGDSGAPGETLKVSPVRSSATVSKFPRRQPLPLPPLPCAPAGPSQSVSEPTNQPLAASCSRSVQPGVEMQVLPGELWGWTVGLKRAQRSPWKHLQLLCCCSPRGCCSWWLPAAACSPAGRSRGDQTLGPASGSHQPPPGGVLLLRASLPGGHLPISKCLPGMGWAIRGGGRSSKPGKGP